MNKSRFKATVAFVFAFFASFSASAQIPEGYYDALKGKKGAELKTAVHNIIKNAKVLGYGSGKGNTWWGFYTTDNDNGYVIDRYSNERRQFGSQGQAVSGANIEHSFPKSWWGGSKTQAYKDLFNLMPSDSKANSSKSNYGMGIVKDATFDNGCIKVGTGTEGFKVWQPSAEWEGDFSRDYMYMVTAYQDYTWSSNDAKYSLQQGDYPTLKEWAYKLYIKWAKEDPVSQTEIKRNNAVYAIQGNRNPFVDFPNLMEYIWGDSVNYAFDPAKTVTSEKYNGGSTIDPNPGQTETIIYTANYKTTEGSCTLELVKNPTDDVDLWINTPQYGWKATGSVKEDGNSYYTRYAAEGYLVTPELDLTACTSAKVSFSHAVNYAADPSSVLSVEVRDGETVTTLEGIDWPAGKNWTFQDSGDIDLTAFAGKKIHLAFHYTSTASEASTWEIRDIAVTGVMNTTAINAADANDNTFDPSQPYTTYDLSGRRITNNSHHGVVIIKQGNKVFKTTK